MLHQSTVCSATTDQCVVVTQDRRILRKDALGYADIRLPQSLHWKWLFAGFVSCVTTDTDTCKEGQSLCERLMRKLNASKPQHQFLPKTLFSGSNLFNPWKS